MSSIDRHPRLSTRLLAAADTLCEQLVSVQPWGRVTHIYNPLVYARPLYKNYVERFARRRPEALFLGMNPGPFGMAQTGIPFGDPVMVREWMGLHGEVARPPVEHQKRPVAGLACTRRETSGKRLWGWACRRFGTAEKFFSRFFVLNYCPLLFLEGPTPERVTNLTPETFSREDRGLIFPACDEHLLRVIEILGPRHVIGIGKFACKRAECLPAGDQVVSGWITHPSGANPLANQNWEGHVERKLAAIGIEIPADSHDCSRFL